MNIGMTLLLVLLAFLLALALKRQEDFGSVLKRLIEQGAKLVPSMLCALVAAGFIAELIPQRAIARLLGDDAGLLALPIAAATGLLLPAGPVIVFAIAAVFAKAGASSAALVTFITSWSIFAAHRILIYELPLLGASFLRLRLASAMIVPLLAGLIALVARDLSGFGQAQPLQ